MSRKRARWIVENMSEARKDRVALAVVALLERLNQQVWEQKHGVSDGHPT